MSGHEVKISPRINDVVFEEPTIPPKVIEVAWNDEHIISKQLNLVEDPKSNNGYKIPDEKHLFIGSLSLNRIKFLVPSSYSCILYLNVC